MHLCLYLAIFRRSIKSQMLMIHVADDNDDDDDDDDDDYDDNDDDDTLSHFIWRYVLA